MSVPHRRPKFLWKWWPHRSEWILGVGSMFIVALAALTLSPTAMRATQSLLGSTGKLGALNEYLNPFRTRHALYQSGLPIYDIKIKPSEYRKILGIIEEAKRRGALTDDLKQWSKAKFIHDGVSRNIKIRIRGDTPEHWSQNRKSWRIRFPKKNPFQGKRAINLIITTDGKGMKERFTNVVFRRLGMMTLRDGYAVLRINGIPQGIYYEVEHFDKALLAHHGRAEGTVFGNPRGGLDLGSFKEQITDADESAYRALQVLLDYERDPTPQNLQAALAVTDLEDYLRFIAGTTLFCSDHTYFMGDNHKLYYDGSRGRFYRIPWDIEPQRIPKIQRFDIEDSFATFDVFPRWPMSKLRATLISEDPYRLRRDRLLWGLVHDDSLLTLLEETYEDLHLPLWCDVTGSGQEESLLQSLRLLNWLNGKRIRRALAYNQTELRVLHERSGQTSLQFAVNSASGITIEGIRLSGMTALAQVDLYRDANRNGLWDDGDALVASSVAEADGSADFLELTELLRPEYVVDEYFPIYSGSGGRYQTKPLRTVVSPKTARYDYFLRQRNEDPNAMSLKGPIVSIEARNAVTDQALGPADLHIRTHSVERDFDPGRRTISRARFLAEHRGFLADPLDSQTVVLTSGSHLIRGTVVVPQGVTLVIEPGVQVSLSPGASIICFGPIRAIGRADAPIRIIGATKRPWGTFASVQPQGECVFRHVHVSGGAGATVEGILFTGALAVHDGDAVLEHCRIIDNSAADGVNLKDGAVRIVSSYFADNAGDGIDLDFVRGEMIGCHFERNGGDAVDLSGSEFAIKASRIERSGDKGISIGEKSRVRVVGNLLLENAIGIASKDRSEARIEHCTFIGNATSVALYRKKPIFDGGGSAVIANCILVESETPVSVDAFSRVDIQGCLVPAGSETPGSRAAPRELGRQLRSHGFVLIDHTTPAGGSAAADGAAGAPGITAPPVDLR